MRARAVTTPRGQQPSRSASNDSAVEATDPLPDAPPLKPVGVALGIDRYGNQRAGLIVCHVETEATFGSDRMVFTAVDRDDANIERVEHDIVRGAIMLQRQVVGPAQTLQDGLERADVAETAAQHGALARLHPFAPFPGILARRVWRLPAVLMMIALEVDHILGQRSPAGM